MTVLSWVTFPEAASETRTWIFQDKPARELTACVGGGGRGGVHDREKKEAKQRCDLRQSHSLSPSQRGSALGVSQLEVGRQDSCVGPLMGCRALRGLGRTERMTSL